MVHNGIEYADMQLIAEAYDLLRTGLDAPAGEIAEIFADWDTGDLEAVFIEITAEVRAHTDPVPADASVDVRLDRRDEEGTGRCPHRCRSARPRAACSPRRPRRGRSRTGPPSSRTCAARCTPPRSSRTRRASTRSPRPRPSTAGTSTVAPWRGSGAVAASSAP